MCIRDSSETLTMNYKLYVGREDNKDTFELAVELAEGLAIDDITSVSYTHLPERWKRRLIGNIRADPRLACI